jgi:hypothetical protein
MPFNHCHLWIFENKDINATEKNVPGSINFLIFLKIKNDEKKSL